MLVLNIIHSNLQRNRKQSLDELKIAQQYI